MIYQIYLEGSLESSWASYFEGMRLTTQKGTTVLEGDVVDQPALHGLLKRIRDLGLTIIKVERLEEA